MMVKISELVNPHFRSFWSTQKPYVILKGGRSSTKSSVISLKLVLDFMRDPDGNVLALRKVGKYVGGSVYNQIKWAISMLGVESEFIYNVSPLRIVHKKTGTGFYFFGCDDPLKVKSMKIAKGHAIALWFEELTEFKGFEEIDIVNDTFLRQRIPDGRMVKVYYSYNPPRNPFHWVNQWVVGKEQDVDYFIDHSTYLNDEKGFLSNQIIQSIEKYKANDYDYYRWQYLGEAIGLGDHVYNISLFKGINSLPDNEHVMYLYYAIDAGHQVSATTCLCIGLTNKSNVIVLDTLYYSPAGKVHKKAPNELAKMLHDFIGRTGDTYKNARLRLRVIDSAEGALRNQYYTDYGLPLKSVPKKAKVDMISLVHTLLAQGRVFYLDKMSNQVFIEEHRNYQWDAKTVESGNPKVIKENDHTCDAFQYFVTAARRDLGLK